MNNPDNIQRLLKPKTVAVIGGRMAASVVRQLDKIGYAGEIWPVNPGRSKMEGHRCFASVAELPAGPDATFIAVPREPTVAVIAQLAARGAGGAVCHASGFAEVGEAGEQLTAQLLAAKGEMAIVGPNCWGMINYLDGVTLWPDDHGGKSVERGVAIIAQSGNMAISLTMQQRALPVAYMISTGNQVGLTIPDYIEALLSDERVTAIGLHIEAIDDVAAFSRAALKALERRVPLVVIKSGSSELGRFMTMSHTSSLAGSDQLYDALFSRYGVSRTRTLPQFLETLKFLSTVGSLPTRQIASISCSGGEAALMADLAASLGLEFPALIPAQALTLFDLLGERVAIANPLDYHTYIWGDEEAQMGCFRAMMMGTQAITISVLDFPRPGLCDLTDWQKSGNAFVRAAHDSGKPAAIVATLPENLPLEIADQLIKAGVAPMMGMEECLLAVQAAHQWGEVLARRENLSPLISFGAIGMDRPVHTLNEAQSKILFQKYGIPVPESTTATLENGAAKANALGYPLVAKILSSSIVHKSDIGGVHLNLSDEEAVLAAMSAMTAHGNEFLLEKMAPQPIVEIILGIIRDPQFGLAIVVGAGGVLVDLIEDSATLLLPTSRDEILRALKTLRIWPLLHGHRGKKEVAVDPLIDAIENLSALSTDMADSLVEVDINPLFVNEFGTVAVDGVIRLVE